MGSRYWVGGNAAWNATAGTKWALTSGGAGGQAIPTAADDVFFDAGAGTGNVTSVTSAAVARSINFTGYVGTFTHTSGIELIIGDGTAGAGNIALKMVAGMTYTLGNTRTSSLKFVSTSATVQTITAGGKIFGDVTFDGAAGSWQMADAWIASASATRLVTLTNGTIDTNNFTMPFAGFNSNNSNVRTMTFGSSLIDCSAAGTGIQMTDTTNLTITANTATLKTAGNFSLATIDLNGASVIFITSTFGGMQIGVSGSTITCVNFTFNNTFARTGQLIITGLVCTGTLTLSGSSTANRLLVKSPTTAVAASVTANAYVLTNVDMNDIALAGAGAPGAGTSIGDLGGCTGVTFDASVAQAATGTASFTWSTHGWTTRIPLPQDDVTIANAFVASQTISVDMPRMGRTLNLSAATGGVTIATSAGLVTSSIYGGLTLGAGVAAFFSSTSLSLAGRGSYNVTMAGLTSFSFIFGRGTYTLLDNLTLTSSLHCSGTLNAGANSVTALQLFGAVTMILNASGVWTLTRATATTLFGPLAPGASSCGSMTINLTGVTGNAQAFNGGGNVFGTPNHTMVNSGKSLTFVGSNTFTNLNLGAGFQLKNTSGAVQTVTTGLTATGVPNGFLYLGGNVSGSYVSTPDTAALSTVGDIGIAVRVALDDWTPAAINELVSKYAGAGQRSFSFRVKTDGKLDFHYTVAGTTEVAATSTVATGIADGTASWLYVTRNSTTGDVKFYTAADAAGIPGAWTQLGTTVATAASAMFDSTTDLTIGAVPLGTSGWTIGKLYRAVIYSDITQTTKVLDADFTTKAFGADTFVESSANAATVSLFGTARAGDGRIDVVSTTPGSSAAFVLPNGAVVDYLALTDTVSQGGPSTFAGANSVDHGGNAGWWWGRTPFPKMAG